MIITESEQVQIDIANLQEEVKTLRFELRDREYSQKASEKRLDALQEAFYRHSHPDEAEGVLALNAAETRLERERHDG